MTAQTVERLVTAISLGADYELACNYATISYATFRRWMLEGEASDSGEFRDLYNAVKRAEGDAVVLWLAKIEQAASDGNWTAAAWKLERRYPQKYGRKVLEATGPNGSPLSTAGNEVDLSRLSVDELRELRRLTAKAQGTDEQAETI